MSEHAATIQWTRTSSDFEYRNYNRDHEWSFDGGMSIAATAAPQFRGNPSLIDPEEALVAAISSCHMLTFLAIASRAGAVVDRYRDEAVGHLEKNEQGRLAVTRAVLRPVITFAGEAPSPEAIERMHHDAHEQCFIANSVLTRVEIESR